MPSLTLTDRQIAKRAADIAWNVENVRGRTRQANAYRMPSGLRAPLTSAQFKTLTDAERLAHVTKRIIEQVDAKLAERITADTESRISAPLAPSFVRQTDADPRYFVSCAGLCGRWLAASGVRPVLAYCGERSDQGECQPTRRPNRRRASE